METTEKDRIEQIMESKELVASQFAEKIGIKSPTLSHILNGRNNPSLDVIKRILSSYPNINPNWLIFGIGEMYLKISNSNAPSLFDNSDIFNSKSDDYVGKMEGKKMQHNITIQENIEDKNQKQQNFAPLSSSTLENSRKIEKIIVYYNDGTFEELEPK